MTIRKIFFWLHLAAGVIAGSIVLSMSLTGVLLTYERQILAWVDRGAYQAAPPVPAGERLPVETLLTRIQEQRGPLAPNTTLTLRANPSEPAELALGREGSVFISPYTGQVLGQSTQGARQLFQKITSWHRWLGTDGAGRNTARAITGACNLAFLFIVVSGAYLWIPRKWSWQHLRPITWFRGGLSGKARDFNWHNAIGIWSLVPLFFVVLTAVPMSYSWANNLIYTMTGSEIPRGPGGPPSGAGPEARDDSKGKQKGRPREERVQRAAFDPTGLNPLWARATSQVTGWTSIGLRLPANANAPVSFSIDTGDGGQPQKRATLTLTRSGELVRWETFGDNNTGRRIRTWSRFIHTGEAFGLAGQTLAGIASLGGVILVWTGISLALRRFFAWRERGKRRANDQAVAPGDSGDVLVGARTERAGRGEGL